jgi:hypothetical protein
LLVELSEVMVAVVVDGDRTVVPIVEVRARDDHPGVRLASRST